MYTDIYIKVDTPNLKYIYTTTGTGTTTDLRTRKINRLIQATAFHSIAQLFTPHGHHTINTDLAHISPHLKVLDSLTIPEQVVVLLIAW